jgi:hypothetical protein
MSPSAEWEEHYAPVARDIAVADAILNELRCYDELRRPLNDIANYDEDGFAFRELRENIAIEVGIAIARAVELELVP